MAMDEEDILNNIGSGCMMHGDEFIRECTVCGAEFCGKCYRGQTLCTECQMNEDEGLEEEDEVEELEEDEEVEKLLEDVDDLPDEELKEAGLVGGEAAEAEEDGEAEPPPAVAGKKAKSDRKAAIPATKSPARKPPAAPAKVRKEAKRSRR